MAEKLPGVSIPRMHSDEKSQKKKRNPIEDVLEEPHLIQNIAYQGHQEEE